jgi:hypothetical protein
MVYGVGRLLGCLTRGRDTGALQLAPTELTGDRVWSVEVGCSKEHGSVFRVLQGLGSSNISALCLVMPLDPKPLYSKP